MSKRFWKSIALCVPPASHMLFWNICTRTKMIFAYAKINMSGSHYAATARSITHEKYYKLQLCASLQPFPVRFCIIFCSKVGKNPTKDIFIIFLFKKGQRYLFCCCWPFGDGFHDLNHHSLCLFTVLLQLMDRKLVKVCLKIILL